MKKFLVIGFLFCHLLNAGPKVYVSGLFEEPNSYLALFTDVPDNLFLDNDNNLSIVLLGSQSFDMYKNYTLHLLDDENRVSELSRISYNRSNSHKGNYVIVKYTKNTGFSECAPGKVYRLNLDMSKNTVLMNYYGGKLSK